jgi:hypothetical protein
VLEWGSCGQARMVGGEGRSKKLRVIITRRKDNLECNSREDGGFRLAKQQGGAIPDRTERLEALECDKMSLLYKTAVSQWACFKCYSANLQLNVDSEERC